MLFFLIGADDIIPRAITFVITAIIAFAYHEFAHAFVADYLGDPTPRSFGRMTLNPIPHLDRTGLILLLVIGFGFAYTPITPSRLRGNTRTSHAIVAVAGPLANLLIAFIFALPIRFGLADFTFSNAPGAILPSLSFFLSFSIFFNILLMIFNLLPVPPLDGFTILMGVLPAELAYRLRPLQQYGFVLFLIIFFLLPRIGLDVFSLAFETVLPVMLPLLIGSG